MEPISLMEALSSKTPPDAVSARLVSSFGNELSQLIAATLEGPTASAVGAIGTKIDVKA